MISSGVLAEGGRKPDAVGEGSLLSQKSNLTVLLRWTDPALHECFSTQLPILTSALVFADEVWKISALWPYLL